MTSTLIMVRPASFGFNEETAASNAFQFSDEKNNAEVSRVAVAEFDRMVDQLRSFDIDVIVFDDDREAIRPDAVFPNNWISFHPDGTVVLYPMLAPSRRAERRTDIVELLRKDFRIRDVVDLTKEEERGKFLEGTGSLVIDHRARVMYASVSERTCAELVDLVAERFGYRSVIFHSVDENGVAVYHTNVVMALGTRFALVCLDAIQDDDEQEEILSSLSATGHKVIAISFAQMRSFAGNVLEVQNRAGEPVILMSDTALRSLLPGQVNALSESAEILSFEVPTIERYSGGSVRCMIADVHLPKK